MDRQGEGTIRGAEDGPRGINFSAVGGAEDQFSSGKFRGTAFGGDQFSCDKDPLSLGEGWGLDARLGDQ